MWDIDIGQLLRLNKRSNSYTSITSTQLYYDIKNMLLLRGDSHFSKLIILPSHTQMFHSVVESTLSNIRLYYWIIRGRFFVKCYFSLIACAATWAVCIEFASSFSSNSLALTLRAVYRGTPCQIVSNNFKTFKAVEIREFIRFNKVEWECILERSSLVGGFLWTISGC